MSDNERLVGKGRLQFRGVVNAVKNWYEKGWETPGSSEEGIARKRAELVTRDFLQRPCQETEDVLYRNLQGIIGDTVLKLASNELKSTGTVRITTTALAEMVTALSFNMTIDDQTRGSIKRIAWRIFFDMGVDAVNKRTLPDGEKVNMDWAFAFRRNLWALNPDAKDDIKEAVVTDIALLKSNPPLVELASVARDRDYRSK